ncbi:hypothetical protein CFOL_v3_13313 [Cephalotus follicularis]|uniref:At4g14310 8-bladed propeller domain-containing protein n=1 Tax=Cephalotus follicularis TaxID=3775 RepID=A0A1Q3BPN7_CEPFO|nr:hypothetical protein CFOL_v3_13313 [Cephalotus follicularis]
MSASSTRRSKDRDGAVLPQTSAVQKPSTKTLNPISNPNTTLKKSSSGRLNSRAQLSAQKSTIRPVPRVDKTAADGEARVRWSTSSAPRGRSPSPSEFIRVFSNRKGERNSRVAADKYEKSNTKGFRDLNVKVSENGKENISAVSVLSGKCDKGANFTSDLVRSSEINANKGSDLELIDPSCGKLDKDLCDINSAVKSDDKIVKNVNSYDVGLKESGEKSLSNNVKILEISKEKAVGEIGIRYPSKLHEKLAFLEGKVKRIASDIKKTKEMLDMNNPDVSKEILSDIQNKISGIEKVMTHVVSHSDGKVGTSKSNGNDHRVINDAKMVVNSERKEGDDVKILAKGLTSEELEARLFPHHKLLRNRTMKVSAGSSQSSVPCVGETSCELKVEEKVLSPIDENPIALEFLASLNKEVSKFAMGEEQADLVCCEVLEADGAANSGEKDSSNLVHGKPVVELVLTSDETLDDFEDQENMQVINIGEEIEETSIHLLNEIGCKSSTGGWFVSEGEAVLLAHDDSSCSYHDIANCEEKALYKPPAGVAPNMWQDCWVIRAPGADGCSGRYVVAASAGDTLDSGFCSWDFYDKDVRAFHIEGGRKATSRTVLGPLPNNTTCRRNALSNILVPETQQWWYRPCGPLIVSTASSQRVVKTYDVRDGEQIMKWEVQKPVSTMDYSSPLQWRNRGKIVLAEAEAISVWDVNSLTPQALLSVSASGKKILALHVSNTDAEIGGGVRQRVSSVDAEGNDCVFCTPDAIHIMDFRHPSGVGMKISKIGVSVQSVFSHGDSVFLGCTNVRSAGKKHSCSQVQQFSLRKQRLFSTYSLPDSNSHSNYSTIAQVWGNSNLVMCVCDMGLFVFDALKDDGSQCFTGDCDSITQKVRETIGPDDLYSPSFDYMSSRVLLISRDRPAVWRHLL